MLRWLGACNNDMRQTHVFKNLKLSNRVKKLLAVAYCYNVMDSNTDARLRNVVSVTEMYADNKATEQDVRIAARSVEAMYHTSLVAAVEALSDLYSINCSISDVSFFTGEDGNRIEKRLLQGKLLVSAIGPGYTFNKEWKTSTALLLAEQMYESRDFSAMPILADALQDAGCEEEILLKHLRNPESKFCRGCKIVDELLDFTH